MSKLEDFLSYEDEQEIVAAIREAEQKTSGEIRVHLEPSCKGDIENHTLEVFHELKMDNTQQRNGVLIYIAVNDRCFSIFGDKGINQVVQSDFWDCTKDTMQIHFKSGEFKQGIIEGVINAGIQLAKFFPWDEDDENELSNEISKG